MYFFFFIFWTLPLGDNFISNSSSSRSDDDEDVKRAENDDAGADSSFEGARRKFQGLAEDKENKKVRGKNYLLCLCQNPKTILLMIQRAATTTTHSFLEAPVRCPCPLQTCSWMCHPISSRPAPK